MQLPQFTLRDDEIAILRNRIRIGVTWRFRENLDVMGDPMANEELELPEELLFWDGTTAVYAQGPQHFDTSILGVIERRQLAGIGTLADLHSAAERIIRAEMERVGFIVGATEKDENGQPVVAVVLP